MKSVFTDKNIKPDEQQLKKALSRTYIFWHALAEFTRDAYADSAEEWNYSGEKYGWSFRIRDKKRVLIYLLPRDGFFKAALVFGQKATNEILVSNISDNIKNELNAAKQYAEGRGIRIEVRSKPIINDIRKLIKIKVAN